MDKKEKNKTNNQGFDATNKEVVELLTNIVEHWEKLDQLLRLEWHSLLKNDFSKLYKIFEAKQIVAKEISKREKILSKCLISKIDHKKKATHTLSQIIIEILGYKQGGKALLLLQKRNKLRQLVSVTNKRIISWLKERLAFFNELSEILSGSTLQQEATYSIKASLNKKIHASNFRNQLRASINPKNLAKSVARYNAFKNNLSERAK